MNHKTLKHNTPITNSYDEKALENGPTRTNSVQLLTLTQVSFHVFFSRFAPIIFNQYRESLELEGAIDIENHSN